jgi:ABC-type hemin transport system ATPase subunit
VPGVRSFDELKCPIHAASRRRNFAGGEFAPVALAQVIAKLARHFWPDSIMVLDQPAEV